jgi:hypothetical protein
MDRQEKQIRDLLTAAALPQFPAPGGFWTRIRVGILAVSKNSRVREEAAELAARQELAQAA